jgi:hypothetical protein
MGWELRHSWHKTDWDAVKKNPEIIKFQQPDWLLGCDSEEYALQNFDAVVSHLTKGTPFQNTNVPEGYVHKDWTLKELLAEEEAKEELHKEH